MFTLDTPFVLLVTHPVAFLACLVLLYALCYVPGLVMRKRTTQDTLPTQAFLRTFAGPAIAPERDFLTPARVEPSYATPQALLDACAEAVQAQAQEDGSSWTYAPVNATYAAHTLPTWGSKGSVDEVPALIADTLERELAEIGIALVRIQHKITSTQRMQDVRAQRKAAGLTARGTAPLPVCEGVTKAGTPCKRKAQVGTTTCTLDHANTEAALALWI